MKTVHTGSAPAAVGPYSQATVSNGTVYTSGQIAIDPTTGALVSQDIASQAEQVVKNLSAVLEAAGSGLGYVVKTTCFLKDMGDFAAFNAVYAKYFTSLPARSCVSSPSLPKGALVEIEAVAELASRGDPE